MKQTVLLLLIGLIISSYSAADTIEVNPHPILQAAPHLPKMIRYDGSGREFHGEKYSYKKEVNENAIKDWIKKYPREVERYKEATEKYMSSINVADLTPKDRELYYDLKSQWYMIRQYVF